MLLDMESRYHAVNQLREQFPKASGPYIYVLIDPRTDAIRYVGQAMDVGKRFFGHIDCRNANPNMRQWVIDLDKSGFLPQCSVVIIADQKYIDLAEYICLEYYRQSGCDLLNNAPIMGETRKANFIKLRKSLGLSQTEFAAEIGKSLRQVQYYEAGTIDIPYHVERLIDLLAREQEMKTLLKRQLKAKKPKNS